MFSGEERVSIVTSLSADEFDEHICKTLDRLGEIEIGRDGDIDIRPSGSLASFFSSVTLRGRVKQTDNGYKVSVQYSLSPSPACWAIGAVLFCFLFIIGGAIIFFPAFEKTGVASTVERALRDLKEDTEVRQERPRKSGRGARSDD